MQDQARQNSSREQRSCHEVSPVVEKLLTTESCNEKQSQFSLRVCPHTPASFPTPTDICTCQIRLCMVFLKSNHEVGGERDVKRGEGGMGRKMNMNKVHGIKLSMG